MDKIYSSKGLEEIELTSGKFRYKAWFKSLNDVTYWITTQSISKFRWKYVHSSNKSAAFTFDDKELAIRILNKRVDDEAAEAEHIRLNTIKNTKQIILD